MADNNGNAFAESMRAGDSLCLRNPFERAKEEEEEEEVQEKK